MTLRLSWSRLRTQEECKQKGHLQRSGMRAKLNDTRGFFPGTVTDRVVRDWLTNEPEKNPGLMPEMVESIIEREQAQIAADGGVMRWKDEGDKDKVIRDCQEAVTKIEPLLNKFVLPFEYQADFGFQANLMLPHPRGGMEGVILVGFIDILVKDGNGDYGIWDVKHTRDDSYWRKTVGQLTFYDLAIQLLFDRKANHVGLLQPLCKQPLLPYPITDAKRGEIMQRVAGLASDIWLDVKTPRQDTKMCAFCDVKHACTKFKPVRVDGKKVVPFGSFGV